MGLLLQAIFSTPLLDVEAGAGAVGKFVVAMDGVDGVLFHQVADKLEEGEALGLGAGVGGVAIGIKAADIGNANTMSVVSGGVGAWFLNRSASVDTAIRINDIVITYVTPAQ